MSPFKNNGVVSTVRARVSATHCSSMNSYPPTFKEALLEFTNFIHTAKTDATIDKEKLCDGVQRRLSLIIGKMVSAPTGESFAIFNSNTTQPPKN